MVASQARYHSVLVLVVGVALEAGAAVKGDSVRCGCSCSTVVLVQDVGGEMMG
jgi:hypothetical protein